MSIYQNIKDKGVIKADSIHQGRFIIKDVHGNTSELLFNLKATSYKVPSNELLNAPVVATFPYQQANIYKNEGIEIHIPKNALYDTLRFQYNISLDTPERFAPIHYVHNENTAVHKSYALSIESNLDSTLDPKHLSLKSIKTERSFIRRKMDSE